MNTTTVKVKTPGDFNPEWISSGITEEALEFLEGFGLNLVDKRNPNDNRPGRNAMTSSQIRNIFGEAKQIESKAKMAGESEEKWQGIKPDVLLLRPKIAYATARAMDRNRDSKMKDFQIVADKALKKAAEKQKYYLNFINFLEAIIAYHKLYGGRDK